MSHSELLIEVSLRQERLVKSLDHLRSAISHLSEQWKITGNSQGKARRRLEKIHLRFSRELERFHRTVAESPLGHLEIRSHLEAWTQQARDLAHTLVSSVEFDKQGLLHLMEGVQELKKELLKLDLKGALERVAEAVLVDHYASLGEKRVLQWPRKIWHMCGALLVVGIYLFLPASYAAKITVFGIFSLLLIIGEVTRLSLPRFNARVMQDLRPYMRKREVKGFSSMTFYSISAFLVCLLFSKGVAILAVLYLGFGDSFASIVGVKWGRHRLGKRFTLEGSLTFFAVCFLLTWLYPLFAPGYTGSLLALALAGGLIGMVSEWLSFRLDDNLVIPLSSAALLQAVLFLL